MRHSKQGNAGQAVAYIRVSKDEQNLGPEAQRAAIGAWAAIAGVTVLAWHEDHGLSGGLGMSQRPELVAALDALRSHGAGVLVVAKRDRLGRGDPVATCAIEREVLAAGARVVSAAGEGTDGDDPSNVLMRRIFDAFAEHERGRIAERTKAALAVKKARGERVGTVSYGYQVADDGRTLEPCKAEQAVIARVLDARDRGLTWRAIVAELKAAGIVSRKGRPLGLRQVHAMGQVAA